MKIAALTLMLSLAVAPLVQAEVRPESFGLDDRVGHVVYDENDVVVFNSKLGYMTQIVFEEGEKYEAHAFGDSDAWYFKNFKNNVFIKPKKPLGTTNLSIITNKRSYSFKVIFSKRGGELFKLKFKYPEAEAAKAKVIADKQAIEDSLNNRDKKNRIYNLDYNMKGDKQIAPVNVWDDGTFTFFKFAGNVDLPAIYAVDADGTKHGAEVIVNKTVAGDANEYVVMHKVHYYWRLRLGKSVLDIQNASYDQYGVQNSTGTSSSEVKRVVTTNASAGEDE